MKIKRFKGNHIVWHKILAQLSIHNSLRDVILFSAVFLNHFIFNNVFLRLLIYKRCSKYPE